MTRMLLAVLGLLLPGVASATTYYVSSSGSDSNSGTSTGLPWQTLSKVNNTTFLAGDRIYFKRGDNWSGQLAPCSSTKCSGSLSAHIVIDAYGTGNKPRIDGGGSLPATVSLMNQQYWEIRNLEVTNTAGPGNYSGIQATCDRVGTTAVRKCSYIYIGYNYIHDVTSQASEGSPLYNAGIRIGANIHNTGEFCNAYGCSPIDRSNYWDQVTIEYNQVTYAASTGIVVSESNPGQADPLCPSGNTPNCGFFKARSTNVAVRNNTLSNIGNDGIHVGIVSGAIVENNVVGPWGVTSGLTGVGVWSACANNVVIQKNEVFGSVTGGDRTAFDLDWGNTSNYIQYNYSHNNFGGMLLIWEAAYVGGFDQTYIDDGIVRFNVSVNDGAQTSVITICPGWAPQWPIGGNPIDIENNTIYQAATNYSTGTPNTTGMIQKCGGGSGWIPFVAGTAYIYNNIFAHLGATSYWGFNAGTIFDSNVFYKGSGSATSEPSDANKITTDPRFATYPSNPVNINDFKLKSTSPALSNGYLSAYLGPIDYWGNSVSTVVQPNRGAYAGPGL